MSAQAFRLKGNLFPITTIQLLGNCMDKIEKQIIDTIEQAPNLFKNVPVLIDLEKTDSLIDFKDINILLKKYTLFMIRIKNPNYDQELLAQEQGFHVLENFHSPKDKIVGTGSRSAPKIIQKTVRSGQQVYAKNSDLIILGSVSFGAEVIADGNIHIYGSLRGKALAGSAGCTQSMIMCSHMQAELVAIAGQYKTFESAFETSENGYIIKIVNHKVEVSAIS